MFTTFRRPPQSHVISPRETRVSGRCRTPIGSRNGAEHAKQRTALDHQKGTAPHSKAETPGGNSCGPRRGRTGAQNAQTAAVAGGLTPVPQVSAEGASLGSWASLVADWLNRND